MHLLILYAEGKVAVEFQVAVHYTSDTNVAENACVYLSHSGVFDKGTHTEVLVPHTVSRLTFSAAPRIQLFLDKYECVTLRRRPTTRKGLDLPS